MLCPVCGSDKTQVAKTRHDEKDQTRINRNRICLDCGTGWPTKEIPENAYFIMRDLKEKSLEG